jgi:acetoacetyl-CoA synthetase
MTALGTPMWWPSPARAEASEIVLYMQWLRDTDRARVDTYEELWRWSTGETEAFWASVCEFFDVSFHQRRSEVLTYTDVEHASWFAGSSLNYAANIFDRHTGDETSPAIVGHSQSRSRRQLSWGELADEVARVSSGLRALGVGVGDRVAAYAPNIPETVIAFLACASLGAIWCCCPIEFGVDSVVDRLRQVAPKVLLVTNGYTYGDTRIERHPEIDAIRRAVPSCHTVIAIDYLDQAAPVRQALRWQDVGQRDEALAFTPVPFDHPLWILFSSGTTGLPKAIVHSHGGIVLEHLKYHALQRDIGPRSRLFWYTTTGWMMWNLLVSALLVGATLVLFDGDPMYPDGLACWRLAESEAVTDMGLGAALIMQMANASLSPGTACDLSTLRGVGSTGSPLPIAGYEWIYRSVGPEVLLSSGSGGTDVCTGFVGSAPIVPVYAGEMSCRQLGCQVESFNPDGDAVVDAPGELVVTKPMPSMPVAFWGDDTGERLHETYFSHFPGVWWHGDQLVLTARGSAIITGRSDATLNRGGVRLGTSEIYSVVEGMDGVADSLVVHLEEDADHGSLIVMFVVPRPGWSLTAAMEQDIRRTLRAKRSPRHVPDLIVAVPKIPRTLTGKKLEIPVKRILQGQARAEVVQVDGIADPDALEAFAEMAASKSWLPPRPSSPSP